MIYSDIALNFVPSIPDVQFLPFDEIVEEADVILVTTHTAWQAVRKKFQFSITSRYDVEHAIESEWLANSARMQGDIVYAVGGGLAVDAGKYIAHQHNLPLLSLPTALSVDAFLTPTSGVRKNGCVTYLNTKAPNKIILDFDVLAHAPENIRAAGICDVLSIATGNWDWRYAEEKKQNALNTPFVSYVSKCAEAILDGAYGCAEAAGRGDAHGLKQLFDCLALEVQLCNLIGHSRPEEGSEHYFAYSVENAMGSGLSHGSLVGPGILLLAHLQGQPISPLKRTLHDCQIPINQIPKDVMIKTLLQLPYYCRLHQLPYGLAHEITEETIEQLDWETLFGT